MSDPTVADGRSVSVNEHADEDGLKEALEEELEPLLRGTSLNKDTKNKIVMTVTRTVERYESFQGPIPPPAHLAGYEEILSGSANRIISMAEKEQVHRQGLESRVLRWSAFGEVFGQLSGVLVSFGFIAGAAYCAYIGATAVGMSLVGAGAASIVSILVTRGNKSGETPVEAKKVPAKKVRQRK
ncbi:MAG: DUF2335 domain-containing protein [Alphaproteobacteria bacterium]